LGALKNSYAFIPRFLAETLKRFCGNLFGKHCTRVRFLFLLAYNTPDIAKSIRITASTITSF
jgi:hypothetical protein